MAQRRMFDRTLVMADEFLELSHAARTLYLTLNLMADDDGFAANPKGIARMAGCTAADLTELMRAGYLMTFPSGVVVITHWLLHNSIRKDRYRKTMFCEEYALLSVGENGQYVWADETHPSLVAKSEEEEEKTAQDSDFSANEPSQKSLVATGEDRLGKNRVVQEREGEERKEQDRIEKGREDKARGAPLPPPKKTGMVVKGEYQNVLFTPKEWRNLVAEFPTDHESRVARLSEYLKISGKTYDNHLAVIRKWAKEDARAPSHQKASYDLADIEKLLNG